MGFTVWGGTGPDPDNMRMWTADIASGGGHGLIATLWVPLDSAHAKAQREIIRNAGRWFGVPTDSGPAPDRTAVQSNR
jgi:hypothetical protein